MTTPVIAVAAVLALLLGLLLVVAGQGMRRRRGLGGGKTVSLDRVTLTSRRYGLTGRPDRLIRQGGMVIPEDGNRPARCGHRTVRIWAFISC